MTFIHLCPGLTFFNDLYSPLATNDLSLSLNYDLHWWPWLNSAMDDLNHDLWRWPWFTSCHGWPGIWPLVMTLAHLWPRMMWTITFSDDLDLPQARDDLNHDLESPMSRNDLRHDLWWWTWLTYVHGWPEPWPWLTSGQGWALQLSHLYGEGPGQGVGPHQAIYRIFSYPYLNWSDYQHKLQKQIEATKNKFLQRMYTYKWKIIGTVILLHYTLAWKKYIILNNLITLHWWAQPAWQKKCQPLPRSESPGSWRRCRCSRTL